MRPLIVLIACVWLPAQEGGLSIEHFTPREGTSAGLFLSKHEKSLRVLNGGALMTRTSPALLSDLLETASLDAIAVGYEDLERATGDRRGLIVSPRLPWICANVKGVGSTHVIRPFNGRRIAFVGVTRPPAYKKVDLPFGWKIDDPGAALKALLPELGKTADVVVLLAVMDRIECAALIKDLPGIHLALVPAAGGSDPEPLQIGPTVLVQSPTGTDTLGRLTLARDGARASNRFEAVVVTEADHARARALFAKHREELVPGGLVDSKAPAKESGPLAVLERGKLQPLLVGGANPSVEITVESLEVSNERSGRKPPPGAAWLAVRSAWKNLIPLATVDGRPVPTAYAVGDAANNLYLVVNGRRLSMVDAELSAGKGGLLTGRAISIAAFGDVRRGDLVFPVPEAGVETLDLHFHDFQRKPILFPLLARPAGRTVEEKPAAPVVKNDLVEAAVFDVRRESRLGERLAPEGMVYLSLDFRARSAVTIEADRVRVGVVGDLPDLGKTLVLKADGRDVLPCEGTELPDSPRFIPGVLTGGRVAYLIPEKARSLSLHCDLGEFGLPDGRQVKPPPMTFRLSGEARACPKCARAAGAGEKFCGECGTRLGP